MAATQRVALYYGNTDIRIIERPIPEIGPDETLVKIEASGICGSDVMEWYRRDRVPLVLGHEVSGTIAQVGANVKKYKVGDRVCVAHHVPCNTCHYCRNGHHSVCETLRKTTFDPGGFCEYVRLPAINVDRGSFLIPDSMSFDTATFIEPLACVWRAQRRAGVGPGLSVLIIGAGISGILHVKLARALGAGLVVATDLDPFRIESAKASGASHALNARDYSPDVFKQFNGGLLADIVILTSGAVPAIEQGLASIERGGTVLFFAPTDEGITIPLSINKTFWRNEVTLTTSYAGSPADHETAKEMLAHGRVTVTDMITHRFPLAEIVKGFALTAKPDRSMKVIVETQK